MTAPLPPSRGRNGRDVGAEPITTAPMMHGVTAEGQSQLILFWAGRP